MERVATPEPAVGERLELALEGIGRMGEALADWDGHRAYVFGGIPGERVVGEVVRRRRGYLACRVVEVLEPSPHRVAPACPLFWPCTGCQWQHVAYEHQLDLKRAMVEEALASRPETTGIEVMPTIPSPQAYEYRNHARMTVGPAGSVGYVNSTTRRFLPVDKCLLMDPWINDAIAHLQGRAAETTQLSIRYGVNTGEWLVQPRFLNPDITLESGQKHYREKLLGHAFRVASPSFFQVNTRQAEAMVGLVREGLALTGREVVVDAYAGVATFAVLLANDCARIIAIEESASAVRDGAANAEGIANIEFRQGKTEDVLGRLEAVPDALILDPPRAGCHPRALDAVARLAPARVAYVSCDPEALARDLAVLVAGPYEVESVQPLDLFPQTHHIECIATLRLREGGRPRTLTLASTSPRRRELLDGLGLRFHVEAPGVDEAPEPGEPDSPIDLARGLALCKARAVAARSGAGPVLGADTVVVLEGRVLGKPSDDDDARAMLRALRRTTHQVVTAVAVVDGDSERVEHEVTDVTMRDYTDDETEAFVASGEASDKAGGYAVQDRTFRPAADVDGCYSNVIGLPLCVAAKLLSEVGMDVRPPVGWTPPGPCPRCAALSASVEDRP